MGEVAAAIACSFGLLSARGESRTLMGLPPPDFESGASAIPPLGLDAGTQLTAAHGFAAPSREALRSRFPQKRIRAIGSRPNRPTARPGHTACRCDRRLRRRRSAGPLSKPAHPGPPQHVAARPPPLDKGDRKSTRLNSSHVAISYA